MDSSRQYKLSLETRLKMSLAHKGKPQPRELVEKRAAALRGKPLSTSTKRKLRDAALIRLGKDPKTHKSQKEIKDEGRALRLSNRAKWDKRKAKRISKGRKLAWQDPESRARSLSGLKQSWRVGYENRVKVFRTPEFRAKISKRFKGCIPSHRCGVKSAAYERDGIGIWMRSRPEVEFAKRMDELGIEWLYEAFIFQVGRKRTWMPDFYLPSLKQFVEIKGYLRRREKLKIDRAIRHYSGTKFTILTVARHESLKRLDLEVIKGATFAHI